MPRKTRIFHLDRPPIRSSQPPCALPVLTRGNFPAYVFLQMTSSPTDANDSIPIVRTLVQRFSPIHF